MKKMKGYKKGGKVGPEGSAAEEKSESVTERLEELKTDKPKRMNFFKKKK